jgi:hypothetical protein
MNLRENLLGATGTVEFAQDFRKKRTLSRIEASTKTRMNQSERHAYKERTDHLVVGLSPNTKGAPKIVLTRMKTTLGVAAAGILAATLMPATAAQASSYNFQSCNHTSKREFVEFPDRGGWTSTIIDPGHCWANTLTGSTNEAVVGYVEDNGRWNPVVYSRFSDYDGFIEFDF